jgi:molecular chaperone HscB
LRLRNIVHSLNYYEIFGLERKLTIDNGDLQKRFYELSRQYHPDRFQTKSAAEQQAVLDKSSLLNDAYRVLRDPVQRAEYVLKQEGFDIGEQRSKDVPPELLEEVFELNMALEELRSGDHTARTQLEAARDKFVGMRQEIDDGLAALFAKYDASQNRPALSEIRSALNRRRYIGNLVNEVEKELNVDIPN